MSDKNGKAQSPQPHTAVNNNSGTLASEEKFQALLARAITSDQYRPTENQVDKMLSLQEKAMEYTHKERTQVLPKHSFDRKMDLISYSLGVIALLAIFLAVLAFKPELTNVVVASIISFIGGYGIGNVKPLKSSKPTSTDV